MNKITLESDIDEYVQLTTFLSEFCDVKDVFKENYKITPFTFGVNGEKYPNHDKVLTDKDDVGSFQTLDYIFELSLKKLNDETKKEVIEYFILEKYADFE